jgi:hypothetical protein
MSGRPEWDYELYRLQELARRINAGCLTLAAAAGNVRNAAHRPKSVTPQMLRRVFAHFDIPIEPRRGRPPVSLPEGLDDFVLTEQALFPMGVTRMTAYLRREEFTRRFGRRITSSMVVYLFVKYELWRYDRPRAPGLHPVIRCRYEAVQVNLIWHTDLHHYHPSGRLIVAFIDDASRRIMGWALLDNKRAETIRHVLERVMQETAVEPHAIWSDNGTEFKGVFAGLLQERGIRHVHTTPYNPEQNGKIERFWPTVERCRNEADLAEWIAFYNARPQLGLPTFVQEDGTEAQMTPNDAYQRKPKWSAAEGGPEWIIDGRRFAFPHGLKDEDATHEVQTVIPPAGELALSAPIPGWGSDLFPREALEDTLPVQLIWRDPGSPRPEVRAA